MSQLRDALRVMHALIARDMKVMRASIQNLFINSIIGVVFQAIVFGYFVPTMGMPVSLVPPIFIGTVILFFNLISYTQSTNTIADLTFTRTVDFHALFPVHYLALLGAYTVSAVIEMLIASAPLFFVGKWVLGSLFTFEHMSVLGFAAMYLLTCVFFALLYLLLPFSVSFRWYMDSVWAQFISPLLFFGCTTYPWDAVKAFAPGLANILLLNPMTYVCEGFRRALLGSPSDLSLSVCIFVLACVIVGQAVLFVFSYKKRMQTV